MNNEQKRYLSGLEARVFELEGVLQAMNNAMNFTAHAAPVCTKCCVTPYQGHVCYMVDCLHGLNPEDDASE